MKKFFLLFVMVLITTVLSVPAAAELPETATAPTQREDGEIIVLLDGSSIVFDVKPYLEEGTTLVPVRAIFEALGATVEWDEQTKTVTSQTADKTVKLSIDSKIMYVNDKAVALTYPAVIINGRTLVPVRAVSEAFGCTVGWDGESLQVSIISDTDNYCMLYTVDGRAKSFHRDSVSAQLNAGWYEEPPAPIKICIDAGHYARSNRSTVYPSYYESDMTWKLHLLLKKELESYGFEVITTRSDKNVDLPLEERGEKSQGCDLFISLHSNACDDKRVDGAVVIPFQELSWTDIDDKSRAIGEKLGACIKDVMQLSNYKIFIYIDEEDRDENGLLDDEYYSVLHGSRKVGTPGVILEHGFHTNLKCAKWLSDDSNLEDLAEAEAKVIAEFFGIKKVTE